jgi:hypothetical protein
MHGDSGKTHSFGIRLSNATYCEIERLLKESPANSCESVVDYCQKCIERYVWRHTTRKYRARKY